MDVLRRDFWRGAGFRFLRCGHHVGVLGVEASPGKDGVEEGSQCALGCKWVVWCRLAGLPR